MDFNFTKTIINGLKFWTKELVKEKVTSIEEEITASETNSKTYTDEQISSSEESVKSYVDEQIGSIDIPEHTWESLPDKPFGGEIQEKVTGISSQYTGFSEEGNLTAKDPVIDEDALIMMTESGLVTPVGNDTILLTDDTGKIFIV